MKAVKYEAETKLAEALIADLNTGKQINIAEAERVINALSEAVDELFDEAEQIEATKFKERMPQYPGAAVPPEILNSLFVAGHWRSFTNRVDETVRYVCEAGWVELQRANLFGNPSGPRFCRDGRKAAALFERRRDELKAKLGITDLNSRGEELGNLRCQIENKLLDSPARDCDHLAVKARLMKQICADADDVCAEMTNLFAADVQRLLKPAAAKSYPSAAAA